MPLPNASERTPAVVGRYEILERVGEGGLPAYRGRDRDTGVIVSVRVLGIDLARNSRLRYRLVNEFRATADLDHPNIARPIDLALDGNTAYLVTEFVDGGTLAQLLVRSNKLPEGQAVRIVTQAAQALHYAHQRGVTHRGVGPETVLVRADGRVKLVGFGLGGTSSGSSSRSSAARDAGVAADVFALGATLYAAVTGKAPPTPRDESVTPARKLVPELSEKVEDAIQQALDPDPGYRPDSCLKFVQLLPSGKHWAPPKPAAPAKKKLSERLLRERRAAVRHVCVLGTTCVVDTALVTGSAEAEETWPATIHDVSSTGMGLVLARRFEPGTVLAVEPEGGDGKAKRGPAARVVNVRAESSGHWFHGCTFARPLTDAEVGELLSAVR